MSVVYEGAFEIVVLDAAAELGGGGVRVVHGEGAVERQLCQPRDLDVLHAGRRVGEDRVPKAVRIRLLDAEALDVEHLAHVLFGVDGKPARPPFDLVLEEGEIGGVFQGHFALHGHCDEMA